MKKVSTSIILIFGIITSLFASIPPEHSTSLINHLHEINKEWAKRQLPEAANLVLSFKTDIARIQTHLTLVEQYLRQHYASSLSAEQIKKRNEALDILKTYYKNNRFPVNHYHSVRQPYFIDNFGTACAVGHLMIETGFEDVAKRIAQESNFAYISELQPKYPEIHRWAAEYGFTVEELAWIQPGYPPAPQVWYALGNGGGVDGQINVMESYYNNSEFLYIAGDFTSIDGVAANSIVAWDGNAWQNLGNGVTGEIFDIEVTSSNNVYVGGDFYVNDNPDITNFAYWDGVTWTAVTDDNIEGTVHTIHHQSTIYIGGDFTISNSNGMIENLAFKNYNEDQWQNADGAFSVNGTITDLLWHNGNLLVSGYFSETGTATSDNTITNLNVNGLAYWFHGNSQTPNDWVLGFNPLLVDVNAVAVEDGWLLAGSASFDADYIYPSLGIFSAGIWDYRTYQPFNLEDPMFIGFVKYNNATYGYGNIGAFSGLRSTGIVPLPLIGSSSERTLINGVVKAAESFQDYLYVAGDFTEIFDQPFNGLAYSEFELITPVEEIPQTQKLDIYAAANQINISTENIAEDLEITFYNLSGQLLQENLIPAGGSQVSISTQDWIDGIYVYQALSKSGNIYSGKVSKDTFFACESRAPV